jgi:hypothetical protein
MDKIFPLLMTRNSENEIYVEFSTSLVWTLLKKSQRLLANQFRKQIFEIFDSDEFFKCSRNSLRNWSKIIAWGISVSKQDVLNYYLDKVVSEGFWIGGSSKNRGKVKAFARVCFIIYAGDVDKYMDKTKSQIEDRSKMPTLDKSKLKSLLEKIRDVIKDEGSVPSLIILILFCIRILILRLSPSELND